MRRHWVEDLESWNGFSYLRLKGVPMKRSKSGSTIDFSDERLSKLVAAAIVQSRVPLRGKEVKLLRKATGLSLNKFARELEITYGAIHLWEKRERQRLLLVNEVIVRLFCAEWFGIEITGAFSRLKGDERHVPVEVKVTNKKPTKARTEKIKMVSRPSYRGHRLVPVKEE